MVNLEEKYAQLDPVWDRLRIEAENAVVAEPAIGGFIHISILQHASFENALAHRVASKLASAEISEPVSYTHLRAHETRHDLVCRLLLEKNSKN